MDSTTQAALGRAIRAYDPDFRRTLSAEIVTTIFRASKIADVTAIRTTESTDALLDALAAILSLVPDAHVPGRLRQMCERIAQELSDRVLAARAPDEPPAGSA